MVVSFSFLSPKPLGNLYELIFSFIVLHLRAAFYFERLPQRESSSKDTDSRMKWKEEETKCFRSDAREEKRNYIFFVLNDYNIIIIWFARIIELITRFWRF